MINLQDTDEADNQGEGVKQFANLAVSVTAKKAE